MKQIKKETKKTKKEVTEVVQDKPENTNPDLHWYIIKSTSGKENATKELLKQRVRATNMDGIITDVVVPTQEKIVIKDGKKKTIQERRFPGYVLVKMVATDDTVHLVRNTDGVSGFIGYMKNKRPTPLSESEVKRIFEYAKDKQESTIQFAFNIGDPVKVTVGPFKEFVGSIEEINEQKQQVTVLLTIFDRETPVHLNMLEIEKI